MSTLKVNVIQTNTGTGVDFNSPLETVPSLDVTGSVTVGGNITGNVTGDLTGNVTGNVNSTGVSTFSNIRVTGGTIAGVSTAGITTVYANSINNGQLGGSRNIIINGSMVVNQRGFTGTAGTTTSGAYTTDRFALAHSHDGVVSVGQTTMNSTVGGNAYADGFQSALILRVTTADSSLGAAQVQVINQKIEGYNLQGIKKGTANAQPVTLSFWVRSTTTGTYVVALYDNDNTRSVSQAYTINSANTWEKKVITFPADTTGVFDNDNALSLYVEWGLAAGSNYSSGTLNTSWASYVSSNYLVGQTNLLATAGNDFFLTGVQLEVGSQASEFERRSFGDELARCQRYYSKNSNPDVVATVGAPYLTTGMFLAGTANAYVANNAYIPTIEFPVTMRTAPSTVTFFPTSLSGTTTGQWSLYNSAGTSWVTATMGLQSATATGFNANMTGTWSAGSNLTYGAWTASAEL